MLAKRSRFLDGLGPSDRGDLSKGGAIDDSDVTPGRKGNRRGTKDAAIVPDFKTALDVQDQRDGKRECYEDSGQAIAAQVGRPDNDIHSQVAPARYTQRG